MAEEGAVPALQFLNIPFYPTESHHSILRYEGNRMVVRSLNICTFAIIDCVRPGGWTTWRRERRFSLIFQGSNSLSGSSSIHIVVEDVLGILYAKLGCLVLRGA